MGGTLIERRQRRHSGHLWLLLPAALLILPFFVWPSVLIIGKSFSGDGGLLEQYRIVFTNPGIRAVLAYTFYVSAVVTVITLLVGYPVAFVITHLPKKIATVCVALIFLPFWVSTVIRTFAWMIILGRKGPLNEALMAIGLLSQPLRLLDNGVGMIIAMVYIQIPFMVIPLINTMRTIDPSFMRAAAILGANPFWQIVRVYFPLSLPGAMVGSILVFISSLGFFVTPSLLGGSRTMLSILISQQASRLLNWPLASALATVALVLTAALFLVYKMARGATAKSGGIA
ncbi:MULTISPECIES: ABC transporter permease [unclassified Rhizobium]|uniref:ABC transporter permease n=1 Tax=unclassified Rhizobium TaxID=2613769 RepID=UPI0015CF21BB|nr:MULTISPECIES: ABC transporter permease [unclassified Rhizobium]MDF0661718.1 ABC transporter permease [Rhizobium sp. BC49]